MMLILAPACRLPLTFLKVSSAGFFFECLRKVPRGQPDPLQVTDTDVLDGTWTVRLVKRMPQSLRYPETVLWISEGFRNGFGATLTGTPATDVAPFESVTRSRTVRVPFFSLLVDATAPAPSSNWPSLSRSHSCLASGPSGSLAVDANVTCLPSTGLEGATVKDAWGGALTTIVCEPAVANEVTIDPPAASSVKSAIGL